VVTGVAACRAEGELSWTVAVGAITLIACGMALSYRTRARPLSWLKPLLAAAAVVAFVWFFRQLTGQGIYDVSTVENPLAVLFVWVQVAHAFDVPARRDLAFSLAGSASLMAVAAAQAVDPSFGAYVLVWLGCGLTGLFSMWSSASDGGRLGTGAVAATLAAVAITATAALVVLPAPHVAGRIDFPANAGAGTELPVAGGLTGDGGRVTQLAKPGTSSGRTRVGGYLGFADTLDTALRGSLGDTVVLRVRAQRPSYWVAETFDTWDGDSWQTTRHAPQELSSGSPFVIPSAPAPGGTASDLQTFYVVQPSPDLVIHAEGAHNVWFPARDLFLSDGDTIISPIGLGPGAIYTVESEVGTPTAGELRAATPPDTDAARGASTRYLQLPHLYVRAEALAAQVTGRAPTTYDKVEALIAWLGAHTRYSTDIPALAPGQDTVDEFLFGNHTGFCEQISTSLAVMLRSIGVPAREAVGYVPGPYNPITDLYDVEAKDAHAWVQVWFPGYGWQSFDPTAEVPLANPSPGATVLSDTAGALRRVPWVPVGLAAGAMLLAAVAVRRYRRRPRTWAAHAASDIEAIGRRLRRPRRTAETLHEYLGAVGDLAGVEAGSTRRLADIIVASAYGRRSPDDDQHREVAESIRALRAGVRRARLRSHKRRTPDGGSPTVAGRRGPDDHARGELVGVGGPGNYASPPESASAKLAPDSSRGR
jgi:transglutaminase-like putative cysteine protease